MRRSARSAGLVLGVAVALAGCSTAATSAPRSGTDSGASRVITATASIDAWGSVLSQLGGRHVRTTSIITNPNTDPHDYEPTPQNAVTIARSAVFVENGIGYDSWAAKAVAADPQAHRQVVDVGRVVGVADGGNPHRWYSPADVETVADAITSALQKADPGDAAYFTAQRARFATTGLARYHALIQQIRARYAGVPVGASESIFAPLADALGLDLLTPPGFLEAISEGADPSTADEATIDAQLSQRKIKVYVFNHQNATPDVTAQVRAARQNGIAVTSITETLFPAGASFQDWQVAQLTALQTALAAATGR